MKLTLKFTQSQGQGIYLGCTFSKFRVENRDILFLQQNVIGDVGGW